MMEIGKELGSNCWLQWAVDGEQSPCRQDQPCDAVAQSSPGGVAGGLWDRGDFDSRCKILYSTFAIRNHVAV